jgi:S-adenosylmethionine synthetase
VSQENFVFSSESVSEGHPDKVADQISDAVLDACLTKDARSRVACETLVKNDVVVLAGEITSRASLNYDQIVRQTISDIGYNDASIGFDTRSCKLMIFLSEQSSDISMGVDEEKNRDKEQGAGDQGLMFGFACNETPEYMPLPISLAHKLMAELSRIRKIEKIDFLKPDAKSQVSVEYRNGKPYSIKTVVISTQHSPETSLEDLHDFILKRVIKTVIPENLIRPETRYLINPTGRFVIGGPVGDCGLTGRKIIVDTYGGYSRHGGGAFSGKDPSKVDRSACYATRWVAKNIVAAGLAAKCEVQVAYAIGVAKPVSLYVDTFGTGKVQDEKICAAVQEIFDLRPRGIIESLDLLKPIYRATAALGHFGREPGSRGEFSWERLDKVEELKRALL